jgi:hypothetical protein
MLGSKLNSIILEGPDTLAANKKLLDVALSHVFLLDDIELFLSDVSAGSLGCRRQKFRPPGAGKPE